MSPLRGEIEASVFSVCNDQLVKGETPQNAAVLEIIIYPNTFANATSTALTVFSMSPSECAVDINAASNWEGGR
jgi:hypothetical protein